MFHQNGENLKLSDSNSINSNFNVLQLNLKTQNKFFCEIGPWFWIFWKAETDPSKSESLYKILEN